MSCCWRELWHWCNGRSTPPTGLTACADAVLRTDNYDPRARFWFAGDHAARLPDLVVGLCRFHDAGVDGNAGKTGVQPAAGPARCGRHPIFR